jgi:hypothetical protein
MGCAPSAGPDVGELAISRSVIVNIFNILPEDKKESKINATFLFENIP